MVRILLLTVCCIFSSKVFSQQWHLNFSTAMSQDIKVLSAPTDSICWFITNMDSLYKTSDAGNSWTKVPPYAPASFNPSALFVVNNSVAFKSSSSALFKTTDGGVSWDIVFTGGTLQTPIVRMKDATTGVMASGGHLYKTIDGGDTWDMQAVTQPPGNIQGFIGRGSIYNTENKLWVAIQNGVAYSPDFGDSWVQPSNTGLSLGIPASISFGNNNLGMAIKGSYPFVYLTTNGGNSWSIVDNSLGANEDVLVNGTQCWYIPNSADHFYIKYSKDSGATWTQQLNDAAGFDVLDKSRVGNRLWAGTSNGRLYTYIDSITILPGDELVVNGINEGTKNIITWYESKADDVVRYELEKSGPDNRFFTLYEQPVTTTGTYRYVDNNINAGTSFYRIRKTGFSGSSSYSRVIRVVSARSINGSIKSLYPIINGNCRLLFNDMPAGKYAVKMISADGRLVSSKTIIHGSNLVEHFYVGNHHGLYVIVVVDEKGQMISMPMQL